MKYQRKTEDLFIIQQMFDKKWEDVTQSSSRKEALDDYKAYKENQPEIPVRWITKRIPKAK